MYTVYNCSLAPVSANLEPLNAGVKDGLLLFHLELVAADDLHQLGFGDGEELFSIYTEQSVEVLPSGGNILYTFPDTVAEYRSAQFSCSAK
jgi:hypothetical protein